MQPGIRTGIRVLTGIIVVLAACISWTRVRSPEAAAAEDSYAVWMALLKGFNGDMRYIGSSDTHAYFRNGKLFWSYYKVPACLAKLLRTFPVGRDSYVVALENVPSYGSPGCESVSDKSRK
jgi:hypothetical protein